MKLDIKKIKQAAKKLAKKHGFDLLLLFGSQATGKIHPLSDCDFGYTSSRDIDFREEYRMQKELAETFGIKINKQEDNIETVNLNNLGPLFKYQILKKNKIIYQSPGAYSRFFVIALQEYFESERLFLLREKMVQNKINAIRTNL